MSNPFGGPSAGQSLLVGLASSMAGEFKNQHDKQQAEDLRAKEMDYQILMAAMKQMGPNMTPSQTQEIMSRAVDIFKPKGHAGIKDQLKGIFGGDQQTYDPQAGNIISDVMSKPRAGVQIPETPPTGDNRPRTVTMPSPPQYAPEKTNREMDMQDRVTESGLVLQRQMAMEDARTAHRKEEWQAKNKTLMDDFAVKTNARDRSKAELDVNKRAQQIAAQTGRDYKDPEVQQQAANQLQVEIADKRDLMKARVVEIGTRVKKIGNDIALAQTKLDLSSQRLSLAQSIEARRANPQIKAGWLKANAQSKDAQDLWTKSAIAYGKDDDAAGAEFERQAKAAEEAMNGTVNVIKQETDRIQNIGHVSLPGNPAAGKGEDPAMRAYANKYFGGDYGKAAAYAKEHQ